VAGTIDLVDIAAALAAHPVPVHAPAEGVRCAAVAVVLDPSDAGVRVLLMRRAERAGDPWSGHVSLPGGRYEREDGHLLATAIREAREEMEIDLSAMRLLGNLESLHPRSSGPTGIEVTPFVFATTAPIEPRTSAEAAAVFWLPLALAAGGTLDGSYTHAPSGMAFPSWTYEGHTIWGLTMRILGSILELAK
jgi:8-oxo-dGTP pyrophosphatase MutT (NUDIX family)